MPEPELWPSLCGNRLATTCSWGDLGGSQHHMRHCKLHGHQLSSCRKAKKPVGPGGGARLGGEKQQVGITAADQGSDPKIQEVVPQNQIEDLDNQLAQDQSNKSGATNHREEDSEGWIRVSNQKSLEPKSNTQKKADAVGVSVDIITPEADVSVEHPVRRALKGTKEKN
ncbi:hypothetical protein QQ045_000165 [Rhodiola kirilowii]